MIRILSWVEDSDLAHLQAPATPDGVFVVGQDGKAAKAAGGRPTLDVNPPVDGQLEDLDAFMPEKLELALEWSAAELPETNVPPGKRFGQLVEVTGSQGLQKHELFPVITFTRRKSAVEVGVELVGAAT
jgi:hypothetical protein